MSDYFPKLLVASEFPPNGGGGGAAVVRQMLKGWPAERLFWWSCLPETGNHFGLKVAAHAVARIPHKFYPHRRWCEQKSWLLEQVWTPWAGRNFRKTLAAFQPDVVWVIPHGWCIPPLADILPTSGIPFHTTMQDFMDIDFYTARYGKNRSRRMAQMQYQVYAQAATRDATSHPMIADLKRQTGADASQMLHFGIEAEDFDFLISRPQEPEGHMRIAYAGSIQVEGVFPVFVEALRKIRSQLPRPVTLEFYGTGGCQKRCWFDPTWMTAHGYLTIPQLTTAMKQCAWGFAPMDLSDGDPRYNHNSFPTKFISYLAAGLPIITLGHPESSVVKMATKHDVGVCLTTMDVPMLAGQLMAALAQPDPGTKFRAAIRHCAATEFDAVKMRATLHDSFRKCAEQFKPVR